MITRSRRERRPDVFTQSRTPAQRVGLWLGLGLFLLMLWLPALETFVAPATDLQFVLGPPS